MFGEAAVRLIDEQYECHHALANLMPSRNLERVIAFYESRLCKIEKHLPFRYFFDPSRIQAYKDTLREHAKDV
jgi:hypothetical protein